VRQYTALSASFTGPAPGSGPSTRPLVLLHGFTQTGASWAPIVAELEGRSPIIVPDAPGHGGSSRVRADLWRTADLLVGTVGRPALWVGYSMGGRTSLHVALAHPDQVEGLVLISATAGIGAPEERDARRAADDALAARIEADGTEAFLDFWLAQPLFSTLPPGSAGREERLANTPDGLASSLRLAGTGSQEPLWARLAELRERSLPVLLIAGDLDTKYRDQAYRMASAIGPSARVLIVSGAGHACHLEQPRVVSAAISAMADEVGPAA
jgi:2-succinyl-6-hydroxy-2,4-cyclohexadiene-1-carboxylate synthase